MHHRDAVVPSSLGPLTNHEIESLCGAAHGLCKMSAFEEWGGCSEDVRMNICKVVCERNRRRRLQRMPRQGFKVSNTRIREEPDAAATLCARRFDVSRGCRQELRRVFRHTASQVERELTIDFGGRHSRRTGDLTLVKGEQNLRGAVALLGRNGGKQFAEREGHWTELRILPRKVDLDESFPLMRKRPEPFLRADLNVSISSPTIREGLRHIVWRPERSLPQRSSDFTDIEFRLLLERPLIVDGEGDRLVGVRGPLVLEERLDRLPANGLGCCPGRSVFLVTVRAMLRLFGA